MGIWSFEQTEGDAFVLWYASCNEQPVKCGEGPRAVEPDVLAWVCQTSEPFDIIRGSSFGECVRLTAAVGLANETLRS